MTEPTLSDMMNVIEDECRTEFVRNFPQETFEPANALAFYEGLRDAWDEDPEDGPEYSLWRLALSMLMLKTTLQAIVPPKK